MPLSGCNRDVFSRILEGNGEDGGWLHLVRPGVLALTRGRINAYDAIMTPSTSIPLIFSPSLSLLLVITSDLNLSPLTRESKRSGARDGRMLEWDSS